MIDFTDAELRQLSIHYAGNKSKDEGYKLTEKEVIDDISDEDEGLLLRYFLKPFANAGELYQFAHSSDISLNELNSFAGKIFADNSLFKPLAKDICKYLYECSTHPKIKAGEVYVALFKGCSINNQTVDVLGIFKSENKDKFLTLEFNKSGLSKIAFPEGIDMGHLDKGCLIFNSNGADGYDVAIIDNTNKGGEAQFWRDDFLCVQPRKDDFYNTANYLKMCKEFVVTELPKHYEMDKPGQIDLLNRSVDYFKNKDTFQQNDFAEEVFNHPEVISSFNQYKQNYEQENNFSMEETFDISTQAVKKQQRIFKSVLKLDKNFHVYIHGDRNLIEKGFDEMTGKHFYKIYFEEET